MKKYGLHEAWPGETYKRQYKSSRQKHLEYESDDSYSEKNVTAFILSLFTMFLQHSPLQTFRGLFISFSLDFSEYPKKRITDLLAENILKKLIELGYLNDDYDAEKLDEFLDELLALFPDFSRRLEIYSIKIMLYDPVIALQERVEDLLEIYDADYYRKSSLYEDYIVEQYMKDLEEKAAEVEYIEEYLEELECVE